MLYHFSPLLSVPQISQPGIQEKIHSDEPVNAQKAEMNQQDMTHQSGETSEEKATQETQKK